MSRVLYVCSTLRRSGPTNQLLNIIKNLPASYSVTVCTLSQEEQDSLKVEFDKNNINVISLGMTRLKGFIALSSAFSKLVNEFKPDVMHSQGIRADGLVAKCSYSACKVATLRNYPQYDYPMTYGRFLGYFMARTHIHSLKCMDRVVGVSKGVCDNLSEFYGVSGSQVILNGVDTSKFYPLNNEEKISLKRKLGLPDDKKIWISVGHLNSRKDPLKVIASFRAYREKKPDAVLLFVGDGDLVDECKVNADEHMIFAGRVSNVQEYLNVSDYFVSASKAEGFPNTVLESLACGVPVLLSNIEPHKEFFQISDKIGGLFNQSEGCHVEMVKMAGESYEELSRESVTAINDHLSASVMSKRYQEAYKELVALCQK